MDIFHGNRKLEYAVIHGMEWGLYLRHKIDSPVIPYMFIYHGEDRQVRVLMTEDDPHAYAQQVLESEEIDCDRVVIGVEGYLKDKDGERHDSIIVQGFDRCHPHGVMLGQMFEPLERNGIFRRLDNIAYLGSPDSWLDTDEEQTILEVEDDVSVSAMASQSGALLRYQAFFSHPDPVRLATTVRLFLRSKIGGMESSDLEGYFECQITPLEIMDKAFLQYVVGSAIDMELSTPHSREWMSATGRSIDVRCLYGEEVIYGDATPPPLVAQEPAPTLPPLPEPGAPVRSEVAPANKARSWWKFW